MAFYHNAVDNAIITATGGCCWTPRRVVGFQNSPSHDDWHMAKKNKPIYKNTNKTYDEYLGLSSELTVTSGS